MAKKWHYNHRYGRGRFIGKAVGHDDYSEESGNKRYEGIRPLVRFATDGVDPKSLNGPVIIVQEGRKKDV
jgi:hypothetical protein